MKFSRYPFDPAALWEPLPVALPLSPVEADPRLSKRGLRKCRKSTKRELKAAVVADAVRDRIKIAWIAGRCTACALCPGMPKLPRVSVKRRP